MIKNLQEKLHQENLPYKVSVCAHKKTSQLICTANQLTGFSMAATLALNGLNNQRVQKCENCSKTFYEIFGR